MLINLSIQFLIEEGEKYFRKLEKKILLRFLEKNNIVISLGGGSILNTSIRNKLIKNSITIFLNVDLKVLEKRLIKSINRPLLENADITKKS